MLIRLRMKAIASFVALCLSIAATGPPSLGAADTSAIIDQSASVGDVPLRHVEWGGRLFFGRQEHSATAELRDEYDLRTADVGFSFDSRAKSAAAAIHGVDPATEVPTESLRLAPSAVFMELCAGPASCDGSSSTPKRLPQSDAPPPVSSQTLGNKPGEDSQNQLSDERLQGSRTHSMDELVGNVELRQSPDLNQNIYYRNKLEFSLDVGWHPINIPFPFDFLEGDPYTGHPLKYTLVPIVASLRWHMSNIGGPWILRGNWDLTSSGSVTAIPRGPETRYFSYDMGIRRNFVPRTRRIAPYFDIRLGVGDIDAKGPKGVAYAQGEDWPEFTMNMGSGVRYNLNPRYAFSAGINYMHLSNMDLSEHRPTPTDPHWGPINYGINTYGPTFGIDIQLRRHQRHSAQ